MIESSATEGVLKFAAIDIGTNAARLLLSNVYTNYSPPIFKKVGLYRIPLQLGDDVFSIGKISEKKEQNLLHTLQAFAHLLQIFTPITTISCATAALREASNGPIIVKKIKAATGIEIEIIDGKKEAETISQNQVFQTLPTNQNYCYIDVGGGSTEISYFANGMLQNGQSFKIGTLREIHHGIDPKEWIRLKKFLKSTLDPNTKNVGVGTGGNISKTLSLCGEKNTSIPVSTRQIDTVLKKLKSLTIQERTIQLNLKPDRAEVIVPALEIYLKILNWAKIDSIYIPKTGLSDALIQRAYQEYTPPLPK